MPHAAVGAINANLQKDKPGSSGIKEIENDLVEMIKNVEDVKRVMNNKYMSSRFRIDVSVLSANANGGMTGDYKVDVQTITKQKALSVTVACVFVAANAPNTSLADLKAAIVASVRTSFIHRVT